MTQQEMLEIAVKALDSKKAEDIQVIKIKDLSIIADYFIIADGTSSTQTRALADEVEKRLRDVHKNIKVAVMGCVVNGPGEAKEADIGIAGGDGCGLIFAHGEILRKVPEEEIVDELFKEIEKLP